MRLNDGAILVPLPPEASDTGPCGVLLRLDAPVAAFLGSLAWRWLCGDQAAAASLPGSTRAACIDAWRSAGLVDGRAAPDQGSSGVTAEVGDARETPRPRETRACQEMVDCQGMLDGPVLAVAVAAECGFCRQLEADLAANAGVLKGAGFGLVLAGHGATRCLGAVPADARESLAALARSAAAGSTPSGVLLAPGSPPRSMTGYDRVTDALVSLSGWRRKVVTESPSSCSLNVAAAGELTCVAVRAGDRVAGLGLRGPVRDELAGFAAERRAGAGYAPVLLTVERPVNLYLVYRAGELIARMRTSSQVRGLLDTVLAGLWPGSGDRVPLLAGAACRGAQAVLFPRSWVSELVRQQSRLRRAGWLICPDPYVYLSPASLTVVVHPEPGTEPDAVWQEREARVSQIMLDPGESPRGPLLAQVLNWVARPAIAGQVRALAAAIGGAPLRMVGREAFIGGMATDR
jgi:hypothetical protein